MPRVPAPLALALSAALHGAALAALSHAAPLARDENVSVEILEVAPPPRPPPPPRTARAAPIQREPPPAPVPAPAREQPPRPAGAPPPDPATQPRRAPVHIGISMSSTTSADGVAVPVGNTLHGELPKVAPDPASVGAFHGERYVAPTQVTTLPRPVGACSPPADEYPDAARRLGLEASVVLVLTTDETGTIRDVRVVDDPGNGFGEAAARSVRRHCRFEPARRDGEPVATSFRFKVTFELP